VPFKGQAGCARACLPISQYAAAAAEIGTVGADALYLAGGTRAGGPVCIGAVYLARADQPADVRPVIDGRPGDDGMGMLGLQQQQQQQQQPWPCLGDDGASFITSDDYPSRSLPNVIATRRDSTTPLRVATSAAATEPASEHKATVSCGRIRLSLTRPGTRR